MDRISTAAFGEFCVAYGTDPTYKHQRFGQAFLNHFYPTVNDPDLFYTRDINYATNKICENYLLGEYGC